MKKHEAIDAAAQECAGLIAQAQSIAALTGAGISTSAGIPDFRGPQGLYVTRRYDPETVFDIHYFYQDPKPFFDFARDFISLEEKLSPTFAHQFLVQLESQGKLKGIITQNIDALHQKAGSKNVMEMHGGFWRNYCLGCAQEYSYEQMKDKLFREEIPRCDSCKGHDVIKPDVVFFGENVKYYNESMRLAEEADLFLVIGTSCVVQPAASIPYYTQGKVVVINKGEVSLDLANIILNVQEDLDVFLKKVANYAL